MRRLLLLTLLLSASLGYAEEKYSHSYIQETDFSEEKISAIAKLWGISNKEVVYYQEIMDGPLGKWNSTIDPIMALGIYAESDADRKHYAELYALQEFRLTEMTQLFSREYDKAFKVLFHDAKIIDPKLLASYYEGLTKKNVLDRFTDEAVLRSGDRLLYFSDIDCRVCSNHVKILESAIHKHVSSFVDIGVDIYIVNTEKEEGVRQWALKNKVNTGLVKNALITLNVDNGLQKKLNLASDQHSNFYLLRGNKTFVVNPAQIGM